MVVEPRVVYYQQNPLVDEKECKKEKHILKAQTSFASFGPYGSLFINDAVGCFDEL
jgi:hypothetical protein